MWSFFGIGHGKGPHDGARVVLKRYLQQAQLDATSPKFHNVEDVAFLREHLNTQLETLYTGKMKQITRVFWHVKIIDVDRKNNYRCDNIKGSQKIHFIRCFSNSVVNKLLKKDLALFCFHYLDSNFLACGNLAWTKPWDIEILNSNNPAYVHSAIQIGTNEEEWDEFGGYGEYLTSCLKVGDNFVVYAQEGNEEDIDFYIVLYTQAIHIVKKDFTNTWKTYFKEGDVVVARKYYKKWGTCEASHVFLWKSPTFFCISSILGS